MKNNKEEVLQIVDRNINYENKFLKNINKQKTNNDSFVYSLKQSIERKKQLKNWLLKVLPNE